MYGFNGKVARRKSLLSNRNVAVRLKFGFVQTIRFEMHILWIYENKVWMVGHLVNQTPGDLGNMYSLSQ